MDEIRSKLSERFKYETAVRDTWVRQRQEFGRASFILEDKQIQVDRPRTLQSIASSTEGIFDSQQARQQLFWRGQGAAAQFGYHVEKEWLCGVFNRLSFINRGKAKYFQPSSHHSTDSEEQIAGAISQVRAETHVSICDVYT